MSTKRNNRIGMWLYISAGIVFDVFVALIFVFLLSLVGVVVIHPDGSGNNAPEHEYTQRLTDQFSDDQ